MRKRDFAISATTILLLCFVVGCFIISYNNNKSKNSISIDEIAMFLDDEKYFVNISISRVENRSKIPINNISRDSEDINYIKALVFYLQKSEHSVYVNAPVENSYDIYMQVEDGIDHHSIDIIVAENYGVYIENSKSYYEPTDIKLLRDIIDHIK